jgi:guanylate kinase
MNAPEQDELKRKLAQYHPSTATIELIRQTPIVLLVGVSGAGKDSIKHQLLEAGRYHHIVSHTTRQPRENKGVMEQDGREYHFIDLMEAERMLDSGAFVEAKMYSGNIYGTSAAEIQTARDDDKIALTDIEVQGVREYEALQAKVRPIFVLPPNYEVWQQRLKNRYKESDISPTDIMRRMQTAGVELHEALSKDYFRFIINDDLDQAVKTADAIAHDDSAGTDVGAARAVATELLTKLQELQ